MSQLYPRIFATPKTSGTLVVACVAEELHELGARMVADLFELSGWDTYFLGANTPQAGLVETLLARGADVLGISATLTPHTPAPRCLRGCRPVWRRTTG